MPFIILVFITALLLEGMGTYISIIGLSKLFSSSLIILGLMAVLDLAKIVSVSFMYTYWKKVNFILRTYMMLAVLVTVTITSAGAFSFLSGQFQAAYSGTQQDTIMLDALTDEQSRLQARKEEIDKQISQLPPDYITARGTLQKQFGPELTRINERLVEIDVELPTLKTEALHKKVEVGPILFIAEAFETTPEIAIKWIILTIIFVFDPLAVALLIAGNFLLAKRREEKLSKIVPPEEPPPSGKHVPHDNDDLKDLLEQATKKPDATVEKDAEKESYSEEKQPAATLAPQPAGPVLEPTMQPDAEVVATDENPVVNTVVPELELLSVDEAHVEQGAALAVDDDEADASDFAKREIITLQHINKQHVPVALENIRSDGDVTFNKDWELNSHNTPLSKGYTDELNPPIVQRR